MKFNRTEYLIRALRDSKAYYRADWVFSLFTVVRDNTTEKHQQPYDYQIATLNNQYHYYLEGTWYPITDATDTLRPLWLVEEAITINNQDELIQRHHGKFPFKTRVGTLFINYYCLVSCFQDRIDYQDGVITIKGLEKIITPRIKNRNDATADPNTIYPDEVLKFNSACSSMGGFSSIATASATRYTMQPPPGIVAFRKQLLEKYKDKLDDPATLVTIDKELEAYDRAFQAQDPEGGFYINDKAFKVSRKKLFTLHGLEQPEISGGKKYFIDRSLSEGWDVNNLPAMINSMRDGSFNRGAMTALGGEVVKFIFRVFSATKAVEEDCGTIVGKPVLITAKSINRYQGNYAILPDSTQLLIQDNNLSKYMNQVIMIRSPGTCKTKHSNYCSKCLGEKLRGSETSLAALASEIGSKMLDIYMAKMHGVAEDVTRWNYEETIS